MGILDSYKDLINASFSKQIKVEDNQSKWTIEDFPYNTGVDEDITKPHCWKCVTVNKCWFKNEENKKPKRFDYTIFSSRELLKIIQGLYHPKCHCKEFALNSPNLNDINFIFIDGKVQYFFLDKLNWYYSWGYRDEDKEDFIKMIKELVKESFVKGNYEIEKHTKYGVAINVFITIPGKNEKYGRFYDTWSCYTIFPNGKLKLNTVIGGK